MLEKILTGENQFTNPMFVPRGYQYMFECTESTATLDALLTVQMVMYDGEDSQPGAADTRWADVSEFSAGSAAISRGSDYGNGWFRVGIKTGDWVSGQATIRTTMDRRSL